MKDSRETGLKEGEWLKLIDLVQKKLQRGKSVDEIADALEEAPETIAAVCHLVKAHPSSSKEEILKTWQKNF